MISVLHLGSSALSALVYSTERHLLICGRLQCSLKALRIANPGWIIRELTSETAFPCG